MAQKTNSKIAPPAPMLRPRSAPIIERAPLPIVEVQGSNHLVSYVNSAFCSLLEKPRIDLIGKPFCEIVPGGNECMPVLDKVYETGQALTLAKEDEVEPAHWLYSMWPALDEKERPVGVIIQLTKAAKFRQDVTKVNEALLIAGLRQHEMTEQAEHLNAQLLNEITERKEAEKNLRESEKETKRARDYAEATLRTAPVPLLILNADLRVNTTNEAFSNTFQVEPGEAEGKLIYDLGNGQWNIPELRKLLEDILPKNKVFNDYEVTHNFETIGHRTMLLNARRLENEAGQPLRIVLAIEDITQRKFAEEVLRQSEERYRNLFNSIDEGFCIIEMIFDENERPVDYRFLEVNPSFEKQSGLHEAAGKQMRELAPDHETDWFEIYGKVALTGEPVRFVNEAKALQRWFDVYAFRIGRLEDRRVAVLFNDITQRKQNETELRESREKITRHAEILETKVIDRTAQLEASIKSLEDLNYTMAHDLRAPVRAMKGLTTILLEDFPLDETGKGYAQKINEAAGRMGQLVDDLLKYGELSHREFPLCPLDLNAEIEDVLAENAQEIHDAKAEVQLRGPLPGVSGNKTLLNQILTNLLLNAVKFVPAGTNPKILMRAEARGSLVRLWLEDNGIGIGPQYHEKIFGVFQRLHSTQEFPGTGVGLAVVKRAAERMGGSVGLESAPAKGSKFWIDLPKSRTS